MSQLLNVDTTQPLRSIGGRSSIVEENSKERVLIVDTSLVVREDFCNVLLPQLECFHADSFNEALTQLKAHEFAVVITGITLPGLSGIELLRKVVEGFPDTAVIVVSDVDRPQRALDAIRIGAFDYLIKPCGPGVVELTVERALERRRLLMNAKKHQFDLQAQNLELIRRKEQLERLQAQIIQNEKMASLGKLSAGVAHELNNPVGYVNANLDILGQFVGNLTRLASFYDNIEISPEAADEARAIKEQIGYPGLIDEISEIIGDCKDGSERIRDIVQNLRTFSRLDEAEYKEIDIHEGIDATLRLLSRYFTSGNILLTRKYGDLPRTRAFAGQLNQVWMNLLVNAAQAIGTRRGEVTITTNVDPDFITVEISDNGCGIAVQHLDRIFDPFYTTKPVGEGTGLGLSISFSIVERHGGSISVDTQMTQGTKFTVRLPLRFEPASFPNDTSIECFDEK